MDPARDFRSLIKQKSLPFGEGEVQFLSKGQNIFCICVYLFGCRDFGVLLSLSATDSQDRAVA